MSERKLFKIKIYNFKEILHEGKYEFDSIEGANNYALGMYNGMDICGKSPTGFSIKPTKNK